MAAGGPSPTWCGFDVSDSSQDQKHGWLFRLSVSIFHNLLLPMRFYFQSSFSFKKEEFGDWFSLRLEESTFRTYFAPRGRLDKMLRLNIQEKKSGCPLYDRVWKWKDDQKSPSTCSALVQFFFQLSREIDDGVSGSVVILVELKFFSLPFCILFFLFSATLRIRRSAEGFIFCFIFRFLEVPNRTARIFILLCYFLMVTCPVLILSTTEYKAGRFREGLCSAGAIESAFSFRYRRPWSRKRSPTSTVKACKYFTYKFVSFFIVISARRPLYIFTPFSFLFKFYSIYSSGHRFVLNFATLSLTLCLLTF